ncbi:MAG: hypothetical protein JWM80_1690 [Cyanobacteria bacterium RYN_339]|nr:hypothetical protein [Cyanobacteria bacterium RYN_339]
MEATTSIRPTSDAISWDWRRELTTLDAALTDVERQGNWDWRRELADLEASMDQMAKKLGLS